MAVNLGTSLLSGSVRVKLLDKAKFGLYNEIDSSKIPILEGYVNVGNLPK